MKATQQLHRLGQSLWFDNITRGLLTCGTLGRYISELSVTGLTSNPTIFDQAIGNAGFYDAAICQKALAGKSGEALFFELALEDLTQAADLLRSVHDATGGVDGWVSLEVSPLLADDTPGTIHAAVQLHAQAQRPNLFIKIPGTREGIAAIEETIFAGVPVNVTLLFSREHYIATAEVTMRGIERRIAVGLDARVASVASIFVTAGTSPSRTRFQTRGATVSALPSPSAPTKPIAICWPRRAGKTLAGAGARPQRLLWASTGSKDPAASDTLYVEALAASDTINTIPEKMLLAFAEHGKIKNVLPVDKVHAETVEAVIAEFTREGVNDEALAAKLQREGTESFAKSWRDLMACIATKSDVLTRTHQGGD